MGLMIMVLLALFILNKNVNTSTQSSNNRSFTRYNHRVIRGRARGADGIKRFHAGKLIEKDIILSEVLETDGSGSKTIKVHTHTILYLLRLMVSSRGGTGSCHAPS